MFLVWQDHWIDTVNEQDGEETTFTKTVNRDEAAVFSTTDIPFWRHTGGYLVAYEFQDAASFQHRVDPWVLECVGPDIARAPRERNLRFLEEALELVQACDLDAATAHKLVDHVFSRPVGDKQQEVGGVMITLAALCTAQGIDMNAEGEIELKRVWNNVERIRAKQKQKPTFL